MRIKIAAYFLLALIFAAPAAFAVDGVTLENVVGLHSGTTDQLDCGVAVQFFLRVSNDTGGPADYTIDGIANGFRLYSPNGATWTPGLFVDTSIINFPPPGSTTYDTTFYGRWVPPATAGLVWENPGTGETPIFDGGLFVNTFSVDGTASDTVGFAGFNQTTGVGLYESFSEVAFEVSIESFDCGSTGLTFCLDSSYFPPSGVWKWASSTTEYIPSWDGPHCYTITSAGAATYSTDLGSTTIDFDAAGGTHLDTTIHVTSNPTGANVGCRIADSTWLTCTVSSGTTPSDIVLFFDPNGQPVTSLQDTLYITDGTKGTNADVMTIVVNFDVSSDVKERTGNLPTVYSLSQNYPNPFNPTTTINFALPEASHVSLDIYNVLGQKVRTLVNEPLAANNYEVEWDGRNETGSEVASGIYFYKLQTDNFVNTKKMILSR
jgi:hypothetical protein